MKKISLVFIFIFLTGLFAGFFFSTNLSEENCTELSSMLISSLTSPQAGFLKIFLSSLAVNLVTVSIMLPALIFRQLSFLPPAILLSRSFATGFCCGMIFLSGSDNAFIISLLKMLPQNLLFIPGYFLISAAIFYCSVNQPIQKNRPSNEKKGLLHIIIFSLLLIFAGSIIQGACHSIAL